MLFFVAIYIIFAVIYVQTFKFALQTAKDHGAMTVIMQLASAVAIALFIPFFGWKLPTDILPVVLLIVAAVFYGVSDRINTTVRSGVEGSTYSMVRQLSTVFMILSGLVFFHEPFVPLKLLGGALIVTSNIIVFWSPQHKFNKYFLMGVGSTLLGAIALLFDVTVSSQFNLPFYLAVSFIVSASVLIIFGRIGPKRLAGEIRANKRAGLMLVVGAASAIFLTAQLSAYQMGEAVVVASLLSLTVLANVVVGYIALKERSHLLKKLVAAILIIIGIILMRIA